MNIKQVMNGVLATSIRQRRSLCLIGLCGTMCFWTAAQAESLEDLFNQLKEDANSISVANPFADHVRNVQADIVSYSQAESHIMEVGRKEAQQMIRDGWQILAIGFDIKPTALLESGIEGVVTVEVDGDIVTLLRSAQVFRLQVEEKAIAPFVSQKIRTDVNALYTTIRLVSMLPPSTQSIVVIADNQPILKVQLSSGKQATERKGHAYRAPAPWPPLCGKSPTGRPLSSWSASTVTLKPASPRTRRCVQPSSS